MNNKKVLDAVIRFNNAGGNKEAVYQPMFDSVTIEEAPFCVELFSRPIGNDGKNYEDTNLYIGNLFPSGIEFYMTGVGVYFVPQNKSSRRDTLNVLGSGYFSLTLGSRKYLGIAPFAALPPHFPMYWAMDEPALMKRLQQAHGEGVKFTDNGFEITPLYINSNQPFYVRLETNREYTLSGPGKLGVFLNGYVIRDVL